MERIRTATGCLPRARLSTTFRGAAKPRPVDRIGADRKGCGAETDGYLVMGVGHSTACAGGIGRMSSARLPSGWGNRIR